MTTKPLKTLVCVALVTALGCLLASCATSSSEKQAIQSGFLGDYSQLQPGGEGQAQLRYVAPDAQISKYDKILMDPIKVYATDKSEGLNRIPKEEMQNIVDYLDAAVQTQLVTDYKLVREPGPGTMRLRIAITEAQGANIPLDLVSLGRREGPAINAMQKVTADSTAGVSKAGAEMELVDAQTGKRLLAAVDVRMGSKDDSFNKWQGVVKAYKYWALKLKEQLAILRAK